MTSLQCQLKPSALVSLILLAGLAAYSYAQTTTLPAGTPLPVRIVGHLPMRAGETVRGELIYPVYIGQEIVLPEKTTVIGAVIKLNSNHSQRVQARLNGDFTPFHIPVVRFNQLLLSDGTAIPLTTGPATNGAPILRLTAPEPRKGGFIRRQWNTGMQILHGQVAVFTAPDKGDRLLQVFYRQLPYHPERIESGTAWTVETAEPITFPVLHSAPTPATTPAPASKDAWIIQAYLRDQLTSATAKAGEPVQAVVAEPVYNIDHTLAIPEGAVLIGSVTRAKPARSFARAGSLGFDFRQIVLPSGQTQNVQSALTGADTAATANLAMDSEGKVKPKPQDKVVVPLILALLATRPLDQDRDGQLGKNFVGANGFGLAARIIALAGTSPNVSAGIGAYGTAVSLYRRWIAHGNEVTFARDTRLVVEAMPRNTSILGTNNK